MPIVIATRYLATSFVGLVDLSLLGRGWEVVARVEKVRWGVVDHIGNEDGHVDFGMKFECSIYS
jgi:hypothetical protein